MFGRITTVARLPVLNGRVVRVRNLEMGSDPVVTNLDSFTPHGIRQTPTSRMTDWALSPLSILPNSNPNETPLLKSNKNKTAIGRFNYSEWVALLCSSHFFKKKSEPRVCRNGDLNIMCENKIVSNHTKKKYYHFYFHSHPQRRPIRIWSSMLAHL